MRQPSHQDAFEVLCLQAGSDGRSEALFGDSVQRARKLAAPFMLGKDFPSLYFEFPLLGEPFMDVTVLYSEVESGSRVDSPAAPPCMPALFDWYAPVRDTFDDVAFGFELDTSKPQLPQAAVHFQPRGHLELVQPFCDAAGEPERAPLYLDTHARMPEGWKPSFFGLFQGRPQSPLRVCGYVSSQQQQQLAKSPDTLAGVFEAAGFEAYDGALLDAASTLAARVPGALDYQIDVMPDGSLGDTFAIDLQFDVEQPEEVCATFANGAGAQVMQLMEEWGIADGRWRLIPDAAFARALPIERENGTPGLFSFTLMPGWMKVRWRNGVMQPSKFYFLAKCSLLDPR